MTSLPTPFEDLGFGAQHSLVMVLLEVVGDDDEHSTVIRGVLAGLRHHSTFPSPLRDVIEAVFQLAVWVTLHPETRDPLHLAAAEAELAGDPLDVLAPLSDDGLRRLVVLAEACRTADDAAAQALTRDLTHLVGTDSPGLTGRVQSIFRTLPSLVSVTPRGE